MRPHVCPWWGGYFIDNPLRRLLHVPERILGPFLSPGMVGLDFGCGMGLFTIAMAKLVGDEGLVIGADLQPRMLATLQKRAQRAGVANRIRVHQCQAGRPGLTEPVDFALAFWSAHEVPDFQTLVEEIYGCLTPSGKFLLAEPRGHVTADHFLEMIETARGTGFKVCQEKPQVRLSQTAVLAKPDQPRTPG